MQRKDVIKNKARLISNIVRNRPVAFKLHIRNGVLVVAPNTIIDSCYFERSEADVQTNRVNSVLRALRPNVWKFGPGR